MNRFELTGGIAGMNLCGLRLALSRPQKLRQYLSFCLRKYDELSDHGLPDKDPVAYIYDQRWATTSPGDRVEIPTRLDITGGTRLNESLVLATVTRVLKPNKIFEIGTYKGATTSLFILNAPRDATVVTLDLPPEAQMTDDMRKAYTKVDLRVIRNRKVGSYLAELGLEHRCQQVLCDSLQFDVSPHRGSVELGFIDGAHTLPYVKSDTLKMAAMMAERGLVFWHDYGGQGTIRPLGLYLEALAQTIPIYCIYGTALAWTTAADLRMLSNSHFR